MFVNIKGLRHISTAVDKASREINDYRLGNKTPLLTFSNKLNDKIEGLFPADQITIAARPGVGKSALANLIIRSVDELNPWAKLIFLYWSFEMPDYQQIFRMYSHDLHIPVKRLTSSRNPIDENTWSLLQNSNYALKKLNIYFRDTPVTTTVFGNIIDEVTSQFPEHTIINILDHTRLIKKGEESSEEEKITRLMATGVEKKNQTGCINIFLSQMNRNIENARDRRDIGTSAPVLSDIFGADSVAQYSTVVLALHRPELYGIDVYEYASRRIPACGLIACHVLKQRDGWTGLITWNHNLDVNSIYDSVDIQTANDF